MRNNHAFKLLTATVFWLLPVMAGAQESGSVTRGYHFASEVCAVCHAVEDGDLMSPNLDATPFETIANTPGMTALALSVWFQSPHPTMPNLVLSQRETADIIAYIRDLRQY